MLKREVSNRGVRGYRRKVRKKSVKFDKYGKNRLKRKSYNFDKRKILKARKNQLKRGTLTPLFIPLVLIYTGILKYLC